MTPSRLILSELRKAANYQGPQLPPSVLVPQPPEIQPMPAPAPPPPPPEPPPSTVLPKVQSGVQKIHQKLKDSQRDFDYGHRDAENIREKGRLAAQKRTLQAQKAQAKAQAKPAPVPAPAPPPSLLNNPSFKLEQTRYRRSLQHLRRLTDKKASIGDAWTGVVSNMIPKSTIDNAYEQNPFLQEQRARQMPHVAQRYFGMPGSWLQDSSLAEQARNPGQSPMNPWQHLTQSTYGNTATFARQMFQGNGAEPHLNPQLQAGRDTQLMYGGVLGGNLGARGLSSAGNALQREFHRAPTRMAGRALSGSGRALGTVAGGVGRALSIPNMIFDPIRMARAGNEMGRMASNGNISDAERGRLRRGQWGRYAMGAADAGLTAALIAGTVMSGGAAAPLLFGKLGLKNLLARGALKGGGNALQRGLMGYAGSTASMLIPMGVNMAEFNMLDRGAGRPQKQLDAWQNAVMHNPAYQTHHKIPEAYQTVTNYDNIQQRFQRHREAMATMKEQLEAQNRKSGADTTPDTSMDLAAENYGGYVRRGDYPHLPSFRTGNRTADSLIAGALPLLLGQYMRPKHPLAHRQRHPTLVGPDGVSSMGVQVYQPFHDSLSNYMTPRGAQ